MGTLDKSDIVIKTTVLSVLTVLSMQLTKFLVLFKVFLVLLIDSYVFFFTHESSFLTI